MINQDTFTTIKKTTGGRVGEYFVRAALNSGGKNKSQLVITLSKEALDAVRWRKGDRVDVRTNDDMSAVILVRVVGAGYALSFLSSGRASVSAAVDEFPLDAPALLQREDVQISDDSIGFYLNPQNLLANS